MLLNIIFPQCGPGLLQSNLIALLTDFQLTLYLNKLPNIRRYIDIADVIALLIPEIGNINAVDDIPGTALDYTFFIPQEALDTAVIRMAIGCMKIAAGLIQQLLIRRRNNRSCRNIDIAYDFIHICNNDRIWK